MIKLSRLRICNKLIYNLYILTNSIYYWKENLTELEADRKDIIKFERFENLIWENFSADIIIYEIQIILNGTQSLRQQIWI